MTMLRMTLGAVLLLLASVANAQTEYPQLIKLRYEATDQKLGGHFIVWVEREKIWYGLDQRLYPGARSVDVTVITPSPGSPSITLIAVLSVASNTPDYFHVSGPVRFRVSGMTLKSSNMP